MDNSVVFFGFTPSTITSGIFGMSACRGRRKDDLAGEELEVMLAVRVAISNPEKAAARAAYLEDHKRHLRSGRLCIVQSGPILDEAGKGSGGVVVADVVSLEEMRRFSSEDPFVLHEVYSSVSIYEWRPTIGARG
jgi:uncharacterized protein YciI